MLTLVDCNEVLSQHNSEVFNSAGPFSLPLLRQFVHDTFSGQLPTSAQWGEYQVAALGS